MNETSKARRPVGVTLAAVALATAIGVPEAVRGAARSEVAHAYLEALGALARGDAAEALTRLLEGEVRSAPSGSEEEIERLQRRQLTIARRLGAGSSESLVPIALLHERAYRAHLEQRRLRLAIHSRLLAVELIDLYVTVSERPDSDRLASELLTSLGGFLQDVTMDSAAIRLYERALELEATNAAALLGLAGVFERQGDYERALTYVEALLRHDSRHREARLRYGINLLRLERHEEGEATLEDIRSRPENDWILSLSCQELARLAAGAGQRERARRLLVEARDRLPEDSSLAIQIAYLSDRTGGREPAGELERSLQASAGSSRPSARSLYSGASGVDLSNVRHSLESNGERRLPRLAEALSRVARNREAAP